MIVSTMAQEQEGNEEEEGGDVRKDLGHEVTLIDVLDRHMLHGSDSQVILRLLQLRLEGVRAPELDGHGLGPGPPGLILARGRVGAKVNAAEGLVDDLEPFHMALEEVVPEHLLDGDLILAG